MQERDYVREIARAVADDKPVGALGKTLINEINRERSNLAHQIMLIQNLMDRYPDKLEMHGQARSRGSATLGIPTTPDAAVPPISNGKGLTPGQKQKIMELTVAMVRDRGVRTEIDPQEVIDALTEQGEHLGVQQPRSVVGIYLYRARERVRKEMANGQGSLLKSANAGKS